MESTPETAGRRDEAILPHPHVLLFDGACNLCNATVAFVVPRDRGRRFKFLPIQSDLGRRAYRAAGLDPSQPGTLLLVTGGRRLMRSDAAIEVARHLGWPWKAAAWLRWVPRALRDRAYDFVARNRHRWFGRPEACIVPSPGVRDRFL
jgi:predicted DCC family thiol-disulfide oxidoreductase YuxK